MYLKRSSARFLQRELKPLFRPSVQMLVSFEQAHVSCKEQRLINLQTFFIIPDFLLLNVVYLLSLLSINSILIFTLPLVFLPALGWGVFGREPWLARSSVTNESSLSKLGVLPCSKPKSLCICTTSMPASVRDLFKLSIVCDFHQILQAMST